MSENLKSGTSDDRSDVKRVWSLLVIAFQNPFTWADTWLTLNIIIVSSIFWPSGPLKVEEMGILAGSAVLSEGTFSLVFGVLADKYSRKKIMMVATIIHGALFALLGFTPSGLGNVSFFIFLGVNLGKSAIFGYHRPLESSYVDDVVDEKKRSQYFGLSMLLTRFGSITGAIVTTSMFKVGWQYYFFIVGGVMVFTGIIIGIKAEEPKRGAMRDELKSILKIDETTYSYQLTSETLKSTVFSKTNIIAMIEGIFTNFMVSFPIFLFFAYYESPPFNMDPLMISMGNVIFGTPGAIVGAIMLANACDQASKKNLKNRIYFIILSLTAFSLIAIAMFFFPVVLQDGSDKQNYFIFLRHPANWVFSMLIFGVQMTTGLFYINQSPFLQAINLPEAQGAVSSANKFLELLGRGIGLMICGFVLNFFDGNYQITILVLMSIGIIGVALWLLATKWVETDHRQVSNILNTRAETMKRD
ncbi:MAG: MFS transporter [Candidatus Hodarchaeota archaeon]